MSFPAPLIVLQPVDADMITDTRRSGRILFIVSNDEQKQPILSIRQDYQ